MKWPKSTGLQAVPINYYIYIQIIIQAVLLGNCAINSTSHAHITHSSTHHAVLAEKDRVALDVAMDDTFGVEEGKTL